MFSTKLFSLGRTSFALCLAVLLFQNCSKVRFSTFKTDPEKSSAAAAPPAPACELPAGPCQTPGGVGIYTCGDSGPTCTTVTCSDPDDRIVNGVCVSAAINVLVDNVRSATLIPNTDVTIDIALTNATLDATLSKITHLSGTCPQTTLSIAELGMGTQTELKAGTQKFPFSKSLANKIGGCTWKVEGVTESGKSDSANFTALICVPNSADSESPTCTTQDSQAGARHCRADGLGYECRGEPNQNCMFNGQTILNGQSTTAYSTIIVDSGSTCISEQRTCTNGTLSGTFANSSCSPLPPGNCSLNGQVIAHGSGVVFYQQSNVPFDQTCVQETRVCTNSSLSGSYTSPTCTVGAGENCSVNGVSVAHGSTQRFFGEVSVAFGQSCTYQDRTCTNGVLSGEVPYVYANCSVTPAESCNFNGQVVQHGDSVVAYSAASVPFGENCLSEDRLCTNGSLSGSYTQNHCAPGPRPRNACTFSGQTIADGTSILAYQGPSVPFGQSCVSEGRGCSDGVLSGAYQYPSCTPDAPKPCIFNGQTVAHGSTVPAYLNGTETAPATCQLEQRSCSDGTLTGTYAQPSCTVQVAPPPPPPVVGPTQFIYSACNKTSGSDKIACGYAISPGFHPERVCSGDVIYGAIVKDNRGIGGMVFIGGSHFTPSASWLTIPVVNPAIGAKCVIHQKFGYSRPVSSQMQSYNTIYYDGPPQPGALNVLGVTAAP